MDQHEEPAGILSLKELVTWGGQVDCYEATGRQVNETPREPAVWFKVLSWPLSHVTTFGKLLNGMISDHGKATL